MKFEDHCRESFELFGCEYAEVHLWLDEFAGKPGFGSRHRHVRHHLDGIAEARRLFGDGGAEAARIHIISDLKAEGWREGDAFPRNERHYKAMGLW
ncbi:MAG: hypothetical protein JXR63_06800 [Spirochaetales bacterium]|nr:hypothetical protein [Spirochaetales bacterium]